MRAKLILILSLTLNPLFLCSGQEKHKSAPAILEIGGFKAQRTGETISYEGRARNSGETTVRGVKLFFVLLDPDEKVLTRRGGALEPDELPPGGEAEIAFEMPWTARAVWVKIEAKDARTNDLKVTGAGPYEID